MKTSSNRAALLVALWATTTPALAAPGAQEGDGSGWSMTRLDLDVRVDPGARALELLGTMELRLDQHDTSHGPDLLVNRTLSAEGQPVVRFRDASCEDAAVHLPSELRSGSMHQAKVRFDVPKRRGDSIQVRFSARTEGVGSQLLVTDQVAIASWVAGWHPFVNPTPNPRFSIYASSFHAPGRTRLELPAGWIGIVDGNLLERTRTDEGTIEVWETPDGIARGLAAGPYTAVREEVGGRDVLVYLLSDEGPLDAARLAALIAASMAAQEARLGPFPFPSYGVVEAPSVLPDQNWSAASQQTFILARSGNFGHEHGNLPLWGHEMAHGWWGNTVSTRGPGSMWCSESLAQLGALISLETVEGEDAMRDFLAFSRPGFSPIACAAGYFSFVRQGQDRAVAQLDQSALSDVVADSKGMWVYHMLRQELGDERFFAVLRGVLADHAGGSVSAAEMRGRFVRSAPELDLETFFGQWLDRTGAPVLDVDWHATPDGGGLSLTLTQIQEGEPFVLPLEVEVTLADGSRLIEEVQVASSQQSFTLTTVQRPVAVRLDPHSKLLLWRPEYGPRPGASAAGSTPPTDEVVAAVVGRYRFRDLEKDIEVSAREGGLFVRVSGSPWIALIERGDHLFQIDIPGEPKLLQFDPEVSPSPTLEARDEGEVDVADRVDGSGER